MKAYKGTNKNMMCRGFHYELGKEYTYGRKIELCKRGFHACLNLSDCLYYYPYDGKNRFFEVEINDISDERIENTSKVVAKSIKFVREITDLNEILEGSKGIVDGTFSNNKMLTNISIPDTVTKIGVGAFYGCKNLTSVTIPNSVTKIGYYTFGFCSGLTDITIPNSVTKIGYNVFSHCTKLTSITIPDSVTFIGNNAFLNCTKLTSVTIGKSVTFISDSTFSGCTKLTNIVIPDSVTKIGGRAFYFCTKLKDINYTGTIEQWKNIEKVKGWNLEASTKCMVHCIDGDIKIC